MPANKSTKNDVSPRRNIVSVNDDDDDDDDITMRDQDIGRQFA